MKKFEGFDSESKTWGFPVVIDDWIHLLTGNELKILCYILRHTYGEQKESVAIPYRQFFAKTGLSLPTLKKAIKRLETLRFIEIHRQTGKWKATEYRIVKKKLDKPPFCSK